MWPRDAVDGARGRADIPQPRRRTRAVRAHIRRPGDTAVVPRPRAHRVAHGWVFIVVNPRRSQHRRRLRDVNRHCPDFDRPDLDDGRGRGDGRRRRSGGSSRRRFVVGRGWRPDADERAVLVPVPCRAVGQPVPEPLNPVNVMTLPAAACSPLPMRLILFTDESKTMSVPAPFRSYSTAPLPSAQTLPSPLARTTPC